MKQHSNIDLFRIYSGTAFGMLYEQFPLSARLDVSQLIEHCRLATDAKSRASHMRIVMETLRWLEESGYIRFNEKEGTYDLTPKSFDALSVVPDPVEGICQGDRLRKFAKSVGTEAMAETVSGIVMQVLGSGARAAYSILM